MKIYIHDRTDEEFKKQFPNIGNDDIVLSDDGTITPCIGCFGCWVKTPGICVIQDGYHNIGKYFMEAEEIIVMSRCVYGGYSPFIKNVFDRSLALLLPFFEEIEGEMCHPLRTDNHPTLSVFFYGAAITQNERDTAMMLIAKNKKNFHFSSTDIHFCEESTEVCL